MWIFLFNTRKFSLIEKMHCVIWVNWTWVKLFHQPAKVSFTTHGEKMVVMPIKNKRKGSDKENLGWPLCKLPLRGINIHWCKMCEMRSTCSYHKAQHAKGQIWDERCFQTHTRTHANMNCFSIISSLWVRFPWRKSDMSLWTAALSAISLAGDSLQASGK